MHAVDAKVDWMNMETKPEFPAELERVMKITEGVMRCLTTAVEG